MNTRGNIFARGACPQPGKLVLYHQGKLPGGDRHAIEHHLTSCEACNDMLEGLQLIEDPRELESIERELAISVNQILARGQVERSRLPFYRNLAIAATIALLIGLGLIVYIVLPPVETPSIAYQEQVDTTVESTILNESLAEKPEIEESLPAPRKTVYPTRAPGSQVELALSLQEEESAMETFNQVPAISSADMSTLPAEQAGMPAAKRMVARQESSYTIGPGTKQMVTGQVTSTKGEPLPGVSVQVKGSTRGTVTDAQGRFSVAINDSVATLVFNYIGYITESIYTRQNQNLAIAMHEEITRLDEVVVIGYGTQKKSDLTGSVSTTKVTVEEVEALWKSDSTNREIHRELLKQYLENKEGDKALVFLEGIKLDPQYVNDLKELETITQLVRENKFNRALTRWKNME